VVLAEDGLLAVDGRSSSGKTTLAARLTRAEVTVAAHLRIRGLVGRPG
jgi:uridine kinase